MPALCLPVCQAAVPTQTSTMACPDMTHSDAMQVRNEFAITRVLDDLLLEIMESSP